MISNMHERLTRKVGGEQGSALVLTAVMMVVLTGFMGLALEQAVESILFIFADHTAERAKG